MKIKYDDAVVTKITVARLFNLGNYEHERIEVTVEARGYETSDGAVVECSIRSPEIVLAELRNALECCRPPKFDWEAEHAKSTLKSVEDLSDEERARLVALVEQYEADKKRREEGFARLRSLGVVTTEGGAV